MKKGLDGMAGQVGRNCFHEIEGGVMKGRFWMGELSASHFPSSSSLKKSRQVKNPLSIDFETLVKDIDEAALGVKPCIGGVKKGPRCGAARGGTIHAP